MTNVLLHTRPRTGCGGLSHNISEGQEESRFPNSPGFVRWSGSRAGGHQCKDRGLPAGPHPWPCSVSLGPFRDHTAV